MLANPLPFPASSSCTVYTGLWAPASRLCCGALHVSSTLWCVTRAASREDTVCTHGVCKRDHRNGPTAPPLTLYPSRLLVPPTWYPLYYPTTDERRRNPQQKYIQKRSLDDRARAALSSRVRYAHAQLRWFARAQSAVNIKRLKIAVVVIRSIHWPPDRSTHSQQDRQCVRRTTTACEQCVLRGHRPGRN